MNQNHFKYNMKFMMVINEFLWWVKREKPRQTLKQHFYCLNYVRCIFNYFPVIHCLIYTKHDQYVTFRYDKISWETWNHRSFPFFNLDLSFFLILITFKFPMYAHRKSTVHRDNLSSSFFFINIKPLFYAWKQNLEWK